MAKFRWLDCQLPGVASSHAAAPLILELRRDNDADCEFTVRKRQLIQMTLHSAEVTTIAGMCPGEQTIGSSTSRPGPRLEAQSTRSFSSHMEINVAQPDRLFLESQVRACTARQSHQTPDLVWSSRREGPDNWNGQTVY